MTPLLFDKLPRSRPRIRRAYVIDAGDGQDDRGDRAIWARLQCKRGHVFEVSGGHTVTELKRGLPCPTCADQAPVRK